MKERKPSTSKIHSLIMHSQYCAKAARKTPQIHFIKNITWLKKSISNTDTQQIHTNTVAKYVFSSFPYFIPISSFWQSTLLFYMTNVDWTMWLPILYSQGKHRFLTVLILRVWAIHYEQTFLFTCSYFPVLRRYGKRKNLLTASFETKIQNTLEEGHDITEERYLNSFTASFMLS